MSKHLLFWLTFVFWSISSDTLVPWSPRSPQVTRYTGGLSQLPVVEMSWEKKSKKKSSVLTNFYFLVNFIRHTGHMVTTGCPNVQTLISSVQTLMSNVSTLISNVKNLYSNV